jgi:hypothetical protein
LEELYSRPTWGGFISDEIEPGSGYGLADVCMRLDIPRVLRCGELGKKRKIQIARTTNMALVGPDQA